VLHNPPIEKLPEQNVRTGFLEASAFGPLLFERVQPATSLTATTLSPKTTLPARRSE